VLIVRLCSCLFIRSHNKMLPPIPAWHSAGYMNSIVPFDDRWILLPQFIIKYICVIMKCFYVPAWHPAARWWRAALRWGAASPGRRGWDRCTGCPPAPPLPPLPWHPHHHQPRPGAPDLQTKYGRLEFWDNTGNPWNLGNPINEQLHKPPHVPGRPQPTC